MDTVSLKGRVDLGDSNLQEERQFKKSLQDSIQDLRDINRFSGKNTHYQTVELLLSDIRKFLLLFLRRLENTSSSDISSSAHSKDKNLIKDVKKLKEILKHLEHFDLYVILYALKMTYRTGDKWHKATLAITRDLGLPDTVIARWSERLGMYGASMRILDAEQLAFSRNEEKNRLKEKDPESLQPHEKAILEGSRESQTFRDDEAEIVKETIEELEADYIRFLAKTIKVTVTKNIRISDEQQIADLQLLKKYIATGGSEEDSEIKDNPIQQAFDITTADYILGRGRLSRWTNTLGASRELCELAALNFVLEELPLLVGETFVAYPGNTSPAFAKIFEILGGLWGKVIFRKGKLLEEDSESEQGRRKVAPLPVEVHKNITASSPTGEFKITMGDLTITFPVNADPIIIQQTLKLFIEEQRRSKSEIGSLSLSVSDKISSSNETQKDSLSPAHSASSSRHFIEEQRNSKTETSSSSLSISEDTSSSSNDSSKDSLSNSRSASPPPPPEKPWYYNCTIL